MRSSSPDPTMYAVPSTWTSNPSRCSRRSSRGRVRAMALSELRTDSRSCEEAAVVATGHEEIGDSASERLVA